MPKLSPEATQAVLLWTAIVAFIMPIIVASVNQSHWSRPIKTTVGALACLVASAIELLLLGQFHASNWTLTFLAVFAGSITFFKGFWKPLGVADAVEQRTDFAKPKQEDEPS